MRPRSANEYAEFKAQNESRTAKAMARRGRSAHEVISDRDLLRMTKDLEAAKGPQAGVAQKVTQFDSVTGGGVGVPCPAWAGSRGRKSPTTTRMCGTTRTCVKTFSPEVMVNVGANEPVTMYVVACCRVGRPWCRCSRTTSSTPPVRRYGLRSKFLHNRGPCCNRCDIVLYVSCF